MPLSIFTRNRKALLSRCQDDYATKMRLKYAPYYHAMEAQAGTNVRLNGRDMVMLSSNDYLGLSFHPKVIEAGQAAMRKWGTSTTGARTSNGSRAYHVELEEKLAEFLGREACHIHVAGYLILADKNIHSCLWDGIRLSMATVERFSHNSPDDLRSVLTTLNSEAAKMLVIEGVYSMEGHIARLPELSEIAEEHGCFTVLDDAHGFGVLGRRGRGTVDHFNLNEKVDVVCGFIAASREIIEYLRSHSKQTIFSAAISPSQAAIAQTSLEIMQQEPQHLEKLWSNTRRYRAMLKSLGLDTWESETPAVPIVLGSKERVYLFWRALMEKGIFTVMSIAPAVPAGKDLVRTAISAMHTEEQFEKIADAMAYAVRKL